MDADCGQKKKRLSKISMERKWHVLQSLDEGVPMYIIAANLGVLVTTVRKWRRQRRKIEYWYAHMKERENCSYRLQMRESVNEYLNETLYMWFSQKRIQGISVNGARLRRKALNLCMIMGGSSADFSISRLWLSRWKQRYGVQCPIIRGGKITTDGSLVDRFTVQLLEVIGDDQLKRDQIFSCDLTTLHYNKLPSQTNVLRAERNFDENKDHITIMVCSNASGTLKLPMMVIGEPRKDDLNIDHLPIFYKHKKTARIDSQLFKQWFNAEFIPRVVGFLKENKFPLAALLVFDNAPSDVVEVLEQGDIKIMYFYRNETSLIRPTNQRVLDDLKMSYRYLLMKSVLDAQDHGGDIVHLLKNIKVRDVVLQLADSWEEVTSPALKVWWHKIWPDRETYEYNYKTTILGHDEASNGELLNLIHQIEGCQEVDEEDLEQWMREDGGCTKILSDHEIIAMVTKHGQDEEDVEMENDEVVTLTKERMIHENEVCIDLDSEDSQQHVEKEYETTDLHSNQEVSSVMEDDEIVAPTQAKKSAVHNIKDCIDLDSEDSQQQAETTDRHSNQEVISMTEDEHSKKQEKDPNISTSTRKFCEIECYQDVSEDDVQQWVETKYEDTNLLSDGNVVFVVVNDEEVDKYQKEDTCPLNNHMVATEGFQQLEDCQGVTEADWKQCIEKECHDTDPLSNEKIMKIKMEDRQHEVNRCPVDNKVVTPEEARDGLSLAIAYFEKLVDVPSQDLLTLHRFRDRAVLDQLQQSNNKIDKQ